MLGRLVCNQEHRLGTKSVTEIQQHAWFSPISWDNMRSQPPPFVPELDGPDDTKYFENEEIEAETAEKKVERTRDFSGQHLPFIGYSFSGEMQETVTEEPDFVVLKELHSLKTDLTSERNQASKLQTAIVKLEEQKAALEADNRRLALSSQMTLHDKDSLEVQLEEALAKAKKPEVDVRLEDLGSANLALEIELTRIQNNYENSKKRLESVQSDLVDSLQKLADKDSEIASLKKSLEDHEDLVRKLSALQDKLDAEIEKSVEKNTEISRLQASTVELEGKVATLETSISEQSQHEINLKENLQKLEKEKASLSLEIGHLKLQMKSISQENQRLSDDATRFTDKHIQEANEVVRKANDELVERIHALERSQAEKEVEMEALKLQLQNEIAAHATVRALLTHTESKVRNSNQSLLDAKIRADHLDSQLQVANKRSATLRDCLKVENEIVKSLEQKVTSLQTTLTKTQSRLENEAAKALVASEESKSLLAQVAQLEASFSKERSIVTEKERDLIVMTAQAETLQKEKITLIEKMGIVMKQYEAFMEEAQNSIAASKKDYTELEMKYTVECEKKASVDKIKATMSGLVADLETAAKKETDERLRLEHLLEESNHKIELLESQASLSRPRDSYTPQPAQPRTSDSSDRFSFQLLKTPRKTHRLSFKGLFRSSGALNETPKRSINSRIDLDEESYSTHERSASLDTCNRSQISLLDVHDDILKGTLKIPKGGKLRKGWIEKFFIVKDFRLLMFDRERDIEHMEGILVADFA